MPKKQIHIRASELTENQIGQLAEWLGMNNTEVILLAVERLWQVENDSRNPPLCEDCGTPLRRWQPPAKFIYQCDC